METDLDARFAAAVIETERLRAEIVRLRNYHEVLAHEAYHRFANHLQIVMFGVERWRNRSKDPALREFADAVLVRARAIAHVQTILTGEHSGNGFADYISRLCNQLFAISDAPGQIEIHAEQVPVEIDQFVPAALVTSELVTNSLKHVLAKGQGRTITVRILPKSPETTILSVADDGRGFPPVLQKGSGLNLVEALTAAMGGAVIFGPSSKVVVVVPNRRPTERSALQKGVGDHLRAAPAIRAGS